MSERDREEAYRAEQEAERSARIADGAEAHAEEAERECSDLRAQLAEALTALDATARQLTEVMASANRNAAVAMELAKDRDEWKARRDGAMSTIEGLRLDFAASEARASALRAALVDAASELGFAAAVLHYGSQFSFAENAESAEKRARALLQPQPQPQPQPEVKP